MSESAATTARPHPSTSQMVEQLLSFEGPPEQFLLQLLAMQCQIGSAEHGAILRSNGKALEPVAIFPSLPAGGQAPLWLAQAAELSPKVMGSGQTQVLPLRLPDELYGVEPTRFLMLLPIHGRGQVRGIVGFVLANVGPARLSELRARLELTVSLLSLYEMRLTLAQRRADLQRLHQASQLVATLNEQDRFKAVAMGLCNHLASGWNADRVSFGLVAGRYVKLHATSHTEKFTRKTELIQAIEATMEECVDQDQELIFPAPPDGTIITRAASELSVHHGPAAMVCLPLRRGGKVEGALLVERPADRPLTPDEVQTLRLAADLVTPRLVELHEHDRWFGARMASAIKKGAALAVGPTHTWAKLTAVAVAAVVAFLIFAKGTYRVEAPFIIEATEKQVISAPFEGYLMEAPLQPGDHVTAGKTVLAKLDDSSLRLELADANAERDRNVKQGAIYRRDGKISDAAVSEADADRAAARADLLKWKIDHATILAPVSGVVLSGDLRKVVGKKLSAGDPMFEVAPLESLRAELAVPEDRVIDLHADPKHPQTGQLASVSHPGEYLDIALERIDPMADIIDQHNVFRARAKFTGKVPDWLRPGMEGVAKVDVDQRSYAWIWTRELVNWIRMKLWI